MRKVILALVLVAVTCLTAVSVAAADPGPIQVSGQSADTSQQAAAASSATQTNPSNTNISIRVLSPGNDGNVTQANTAGSSAAAGNASNTSQGSSQTAGGGNPIQSSTQSASTGQVATALSLASQYGASNTNVPIRVLSPGNDGNVSQTNAVGSHAAAGNAAGTSQTGTQTAAGGELVWLLRRQHADPDVRPVGIDRPGRHGAVGCEADRPVEHLGLGARSEPGQRRQRLAGEHRRIVGARRQPRGDDAEQPSDCSCSFVWMLGHGNPAGRPVGRDGPGGRRTVGSHSGRPVE